MRLLNFLTQGGVWIMLEAEGGFEIELIRTPGHKLRKVVVVLAEGLGLFRNTSLTDLVVREWHAAGQPKDWLFVVTGRKDRRYWRAPIKVLDNTSQRCETFNIETECMRLYCGLVVGGIPVQNIIIESRSDTTAQQRTYVYDLLQEVTASSFQGPYPVTLVCTDVHAPRAVGIFNKGGKFTVEPVEGIGVWTDPYFPDISSDLADRGNWIHVMPYRIYVVLERLATYRDIKLGYLDEVPVIQPRPLGPIL